jgi:hypothetical protein
VGPLRDHNPEAHARGEALARADRGKAIRELEEQIAELERGDTWTRTVKLPASLDRIAHLYAAEDADHPELTRSNP